MNDYNSHPEPDPSGQLDEYVAAYMGGIVDSKMNLAIRVVKTDNSQIDHRAYPELTLTTDKVKLINIIVAWCNDRGIDTNKRIRELKTQTTYEVQIESRDSVKTFLELVQPFVLVKHNEIRLLLEHILPYLDKSNIHKDIDLFIEFMEYVDNFNDMSGRESKYDQDYFKELRQRDVLE